MKRCRLVYRSVAAPSLLEGSVLAGLVDRAAERNAAAGITGLLVLSGHRFLQVLEGPVGFVNELMARIIADKRHSRFELLSYDQSVSPLFYDWSMTILRLNEVLPALREVLIAKYDLEQGDIRVPDDSFSAHSLLLDARWARATADPNAGK
jgi:hypothetical protein